MRQKIKAKLKPRKWGKEDLRGLGGLLKKKISKQLPKKKRRRRRPSTRKPKARKPKATKPKVKLTKAEKEVVAAIRHEREMRKGGRYARKQLEREGGVFRPPKKKRRK